MSTPATPLQVIEKKLGVWFDPTHLILLGLLVAAAVTGVYLYDSKRADAAEAKSQADAAQIVVLKKEAETSAQQNTTFQQLTAQQVAQLTAVNASLAQVNKQLADSVKTANIALENQKHVDAQMTPTQQSSRWQTLVPQATVAATPTGFAVDAAGGLATIIELEKVPVLTTTVNTLSATIANDDKTIENDADILSKERASHTSDVTNDAKQLGLAQGETKKAKDDLDTANKKHRNAVIRAYFAGVASAFVIKKLIGF